MKVGKMNVQGIDVGNLAIELPLVIPDVVTGRVLHIDGDHYCYLAGAFDDEPFSVAKQNFVSLVDTAKAASGAEHTVIHMTGANKGGRYDLATVKEYQANRKGKKKPKHLYHLREWVQEKYCEVVYHEDQEADDGMCQGNYEACQSGRTELSVICSVDKDLRMCSGLYLHPQSSEVCLIDGYGELDIIKGKTTKVKGVGTSFFWFQMLAGDTADNIPGLPALGTETRVEYPEFRTKQINKILDKIEAGEESAVDELESLKPKKCGAVAAYTILKDCKDDMAALISVANAYRAYYGDTPFDYVDFRGETRTSNYKGMMQEQGGLLWMRRTKDDRVTDFFTDVMNGGDWYGA